MIEKFKFLFTKLGYVNTAWIRQDRFKNKFPDLYNEVMQMFPEYKTLKDKLRAMQNGDYFRCYTCGKIVLPPINRKVARVYCCSKCGNNSEYKLSASQKATQSEEVKEKRRRTNIEKYGVPTPFQSKDIQDKCRKTTIEKYGVVSASCLPEIKEKMQSTRKRHRNEIEKQHIERKLEYIKTLGIECSFEQAKTISVGHKCNRRTKEYIEAQLGLREMTLSLIKDNYINFYPAAHYYGLMPNYSESAQAKVISEFLESIGVEYIVNERNIIRPQELDIVIPSKKIAIEVNGYYYHNSFKLEDNQYHGKKSNKAEEAGYQLLHFWDFEINGNGELVKSIIRSKLGFVEHKFHARKCRIVELDKDTERFFFDENHLSGSARSKICYGLMSDDELVFAMSFAKYRFSKSDSWEIVRMASKKNCSVSGGMSKLLNHFIKEYNPKSILSYADRRISQGKSYEALGFNKIRTTRFGYCYYKPRTGVIPRQHLMKSRLKKLGYDSNKTEDDIAKEMGLFKLCDAGHILYELKL